MASQDKKKSKKRKEGNFSSNFPSLSDTTSASSSSLAKKLCFIGKEEDFDGNMNCFVVTILKKQLTKDILELAAFDHNLLHIENNNIREEEPTNILTPIFSFPKKNTTVPLFGNSFATLDPFVFSIGGTFHPIRHHHRSRKTGSKMVHYFDTTKQHDKICWIQAPCMLTNRQNPQVVTLNSRLYVFGCLGELKCPHKRSCLWAETFDPSTGEWSALTVPEFKHFLVVSSSPTLKKKKDSSVLRKISAISDNNFLYLFDTETGYWNCKAKLKVGLGRTIKQHAFVHKVLYWFEDEGYKAHAYDIVKKKIFEGPVQDLSFVTAMCGPPKEDDDYFDYFDDDVNDPKPVIIHLGRRYFGLFGSLPDLEEHSPMRVHLLVVKVSTTNEVHECYELPRWDMNTFFLGARVVSCQSFPIDQKMDFLDGRVLTFY